MPSRAWIDTPVSALEALTQAFGPSSTLKALKSRSRIMSAPVVFFYVKALAYLGRQDIAPPSHGRHRKRDTRTAMAGKQDDGSKDLRSFGGQRRA